jgi:hypothetical protein
MNLHLICERRLITVYMFLFFFSLKRKFHWTGNGLVISVQKKFIETLREAVVLFFGGGSVFTCRK